MSDKSHQSSANEPSNNTVKDSSAMPLQDATAGSPEYDHVYVRAFSGVEFIIMIGVIILCLFYQFGWALLILLASLIFYRKVGIRDPKTGQSWVISRQAWHNYCNYNHINWKYWKEQSVAERVAKHIEQRQQEDGSK